MQIMNFFEVKPGSLRAPVLIVGVLDGIHQGHQQLISLGKELCGQVQGELAVAVFSPHPMQVLKGQSPPFITSLATRLALLERAGVDVALLIHFNREVTKIPAQVFISQYLVQNLGIRGIVAGANFHFGYQGEGTVALLQAMAETCHYQVKIAELLKLPDGTPISSSNIRQAVQSGDMGRARAMLGRPFTLLGKVIKGEARARTLGFPTANLELMEKLVPAQGVYGGYTLIAGETYPALISIGTAPTFNSDGLLKIEVHLRHFAGDLYGKMIETCMIEKIREQIKFPSKESLCCQIEADCRYLDSHWDSWFGELRQSAATACWW